jgi:CheY-like chemotaxis protein
MASASTSRGRVLVVDDDRAQRRLFTLELEGEGFDAEAVASGEECLERFMELAPDVVLLDIGLPGMDGVQTCRALKRHPVACRVPVIFLSGRQEDDPVVVEALLAGGSEFISKDAPPDVFHARLTSQIAFQRAAQRFEDTAPLDDDGLFTERFVLESLRRGARAALRNDGALCCLSVVTDDALELPALARRVGAALRECDLVGTRGQTVIAALANAGADSGVSLADAARSAVHEAGASASIGVAVIDADSERRRAVGEDVAEWAVLRAEKAREAARGAGGDRVEVSRNP